MRKLLKVASVLLLVLLAVNHVQAQAKVGYIAFNEVVQLMPEYKTIEAQMTAYQKQWTDQLQTINDDYTKKLKEYQEPEKTLTDAAKATLQADLQALQKRYEDLTASARQAVEQKGAEYSKPVFDKVKAAINTVAKEKGYTHIINSNETELLVAPDADNLLPAVKIKLGLK